MTKRTRVYVQILNQTQQRWYNYQSAKTVGEAEKRMREFQEQSPKAIFRVRDNNLITHTY